MTASYPITLNDLLVAHANPAAMTSYTLDIGSVSEPQRSSGLWIATAAGSTAAIRAAGGRILPLRSRKLQYLVREPYNGGRCRYRLRKGIVGPETLLTVISKTRRGRLFIDGPHLRFSASATWPPTAAPLRVWGSMGTAAGGLISGFVCIEERVSKRQYAPEQRLGAARCCSR